MLTGCLPRFWRLWPIRGAVGPTLGRETPPVLSTATHGSARFPRVSGALAWISFPSSPIPLLNLHWYLHLWAQRPPPSRYTGKTVTGHVYWQSGDALDVTDNLLRTWTCTGKLTFTSEHTKTGPCSRSRENGLQFLNAINALFSYISPATVLKMAAANSGLIWYDTEAANDAIYNDSFFKLSSTHFMD